MMNYKYSLITIFIAVAAVLMTGCKEEDPFNGIDNYISSFQLNQNGTILTGIISENNLSIVAPANFSLNGATATAIISENSTISPDPSEITDWDNSQTFTVKSYNGSDRVYNYSVTRSDLIKNGNVTLLTQADVETFSALEISEINGSLTIGATSGTDSVKSLASLSKLETITYDLIINPTYCGNNLSGLENLKKTGSIQIGPLTQLKQAVFPSLTSVMTDIIVSKAQITSLEFPELVNVDNSITIISVDSLVKLSFPKLKKVIATITLQGSSCNRMNIIEFPAVETIGGNIIFSRFNYLTSVYFPALTKVRAIILTGLSKLETISIPALKEINDYADISNNPLLTTLDLSSLFAVTGSLNLQTLPLLENLDGFKSLQTVGRDLNFSYLDAVEDINGLKSLVSVGESLTLNSFPLVKDLKGLSSLVSVGKALNIYRIPFKTLSELSSLSSLKILNINNSDIVSIEEIDVTKLELLEVINISNVYNSFVLKGPETFDGTMCLQYSNFELEGFDQVKNLTIDGFDTSSNVVDKEMGIKTITGNFELYLFDMTGTFLMSELENVEGTFTYCGTVKIALPKFKAAGSIDFTPGFNDILNLPSLETVKGDFKIVSGNYQGEVTDIKMPSLTTVGGALVVSGYSNYYNNKTMTTLNGFSNLTMAGSLTISYNLALIDYSGLKNVIPSLSASTLTISGNSYNPTYQDLLDEKWVKE